MERTALRNLGCDAKPQTRGAIRSARGEALCRHDRRCREQGAVCEAEVLDHAESFAAALALKPLERKQPPQPTPY